MISVGDYAFGTNSLTEIRIPSSVESIGAQAFSGNSNLKDVYAYTAEPINIDTNTFSNYGAATLHVFQMENDEIFNNYYADPQWGQFPEIVNFTDEYQYFYLNNDMTLESRFTDEQMQDAIYILEFKFGKTAHEDTEQILKKDYAIRFAQDARPVFAVGLNISADRRTLRATR